MLFDLLQGGDFVQSLIRLVTVIPAVLLALTLHEVAHGYVAYRLGDPTAKVLGRLTLNPLKHLDPIGTVLMLLTGYGWAKPVPVNARYFKNPKKGMALTALAGPLVNLTLGLIFAVLYAISYSLAYKPFMLAYYGSREAIPLLVFALVSFLGNFAMLNVAYAIFNLFPLPPFDGSRVLFLFLPQKWYFAVMKYERILMLIVLIGMASGVLWTPISYLIDFVFESFINLAFLIFPI